MKVTIEKRNANSKDKAYRYKHDGFLPGSTWIDSDEGKVVTIIDGQGMAGMPEVSFDDGTTYYANPLSLTPYNT